MNDTRDQAYYVPPQRDNSVELHLDPDFARELIASYEVGEVDEKTRREIYGGDGYVDPVTLKEIKEAHADIAWCDYFMGLAFEASQRSPDAQTKHGCVIVDRNRHVMGTGYNGFPRGMNDASLPRTRPEKYPWMIHSEENALANCTVSPWTIPEGAIAYVTGRPCFHCSILLWQNHVTKIVYADRKGWSVPRPEEEENFEVFRQQTGVKVQAVKPNLNWLNNTALIAELKELGFIS